MIKSINSVLKEVLEENEISEEDSVLIDNSVNEFVGIVKNRLNVFKKKPEIFFGGSFAKKTMIKKDVYDVDIFLRFDKWYKGKNLSDITAGILKGFKGVKRVHGSRDYFIIKIHNNLFLEVVPVLKINSKDTPENITDLSYSHVKYINKKIKSKKILDDIKLAKKFCYANRCYGAESYIQGFSGYALELLVYHYGSFLKMVRALCKNSKDKIIIDIEKKYKNKKRILLDMNSSKLESPIILVDPTYPGRNALAALSEETFDRFRDACKKFLKIPSKKYFEIQDVDLNSIKKKALSKKQEFILLEASTVKQEGDVAGTKLLKFYNHLSSEIERFFDIKGKGFNYNGKSSARYFFVVSKKKEVLYSGPSVKDLKNVKRFRKEHRNVRVKGNNLIAKEKINFSVNNFIKKWKVKNKRKVKEMSISKLEEVSF